MRKVRNSRECEKILRSGDCPKRQGKGSHIIAELPNGQTIVYYPGEWSDGVACKITKALQAAGLLALFTALFTGLLFELAGTF